MMGTVKIRTNSGVTMKAPIDTAGELDKVIKFLIAERDALLKSEGKQQKKSKLAEEGHHDFKFCDVCYWCDFRSMRDVAHGDG